MYAALRGHTASQWERREARQMEELADYQRTSAEAAAATVAAADGTGTP